MRLEDYWGVGPKTSARLESALGVERAIEAIESGDLRTLVDAGVERGRATRILRRAASEAGMDVLATRDTRSVYRDVLDLAADHAVTQSATDRIRTLTPLVDRTTMEGRQDRIAAARETWAELDDSTRTAVLGAYETYDEAGETRLAGVQTAIELVEVGATTGLFEPFGGLDPDGLAEAADALAAIDDGAVRDGADDELDRLRSALGRVESMAATPVDVVDELTSAGVRDTTGFREELVDHVCRETAVDAARVRAVTPGEAVDATAFVSETLRALTDDLHEAVTERERTVRQELEGAVDTASDDVEAATAAVDDVALWLSLARFANAYDLVRPEYLTERDAIAIDDAHNLSLVAEDDVAVTPITYAIGDHDLERPPCGERVTVVTGANSGGKTTLLETCCQVTLLATMGLPVPAGRAQLTPPERIVFHRRHASFNAGVLESTLRSVVPPLTEGNRTLMLVDEFEAITEPGRAADLLHGLVTLTVEADALGAFVTHLAGDLEPLPDPARIDGIFAEGLTPELELEVDYQPRFGQVGKSTPEFIVSRLVADAEDRSERAGFETLAEAVDTEVVQRTLADARFQEAD